MWCKCVQNLSVDKSLVHKLTGSMKELFRSGEGEYRLSTFKCC